MAVILVLPNSRSEVSGSVRPNDAGSPGQKRSVILTLLELSTKLPKFLKKQISHL